MNTTLVNIPKGEAFTVYYSVPVAGYNDGNSTVINNPTNSKISKDGGAFTNTANSQTYVDVSIASLTLTAEEMNADVITIYVNRTSTGSETFNVIYIFTDNYNPISGGASAEDIANAVVGNLENLREFIKKYASGFTQKQLLALVVKLLKT